MEILDYRGPRVPSAGKRLRSTSPYPAPGRACRLAWSGFLIRKCRWTSRIPFPATCASTRLTGLPQAPGSCCFCNPACSSLLPPPAEALPIPGGPLKPCVPEALNPPPAAPAARAPPAALAVPS